MDASPAALAGVSDSDAQHLADAFNITTVRQLGSSKYFTVASALLSLENAG